MKFYYKSRKAGISNGKIPASPIPANESRKPAQRRQAEVRGGDRPGVRAFAHGRTGLLAHSESRALLLRRHRALRFSGEGEAFVTHSRWEALAIQLGFSIPH